MYTTLGGWMGTACEDPTGGGGGGGGQGSSCDTSACGGYTNECSSNPNSQAPCYCAAACDCHYCGDTQCEQQNRASAMSLGTTCSY